MKALIAISRAYIHLSSLTSMAEYECKQPGIVLWAMHHSKPIVWRSTRAAVRRQTDNEQVDYTQEK